MFRRFVGSALAAVTFAIAWSGVAASRAQAQTGRTRTVSTPDPDYWVGLSIGYVEGMTTTDQASGATWQFGYTSQIRATLEKTLQRGTTIGIAAGFANAPLTYTSGGQFGDGCDGQCRAQADETQYTVYLRGGGLGGYGGLHGIYTVEGGVTQFSNFRDESTNQQLQPMDGSYDATFGLGGGAGYTISRTADLYVTEMLDFVLHHQSTAIVAQSAPRFLTLRAGFRVGF
jgi:hypothetical protein